MPTIEPEFARGDVRASGLPVAGSDDSQSTPWPAFARVRGAGRAVPHPVHWVTAAALAAIAVALWTRPHSPDLASVALGQPTTMAGSRGVFAFTGQLSKSSYGVYMVDMDTMTLWAYEFQPQKGCLRLAASRTWRYDRYLENHNICDLPPDAVEQMIEDQRKYRMDAAQEEAPETRP